MRVSFEKRTVSADQMSFAQPAYHVHADPWAFAYCKQFAHLTVAAGRKISVQMAPCADWLICTHVLPLAH